MTMIVFRTEPDYVQLMCDGLASNITLTKVMPTREHFATFGDHATVVAAAGHQGAARAWRHLIESGFAKGYDFDELADRIRDLTHLSAHPREGDEFAIDAYLSGWSARHQRFKTYLCSSLNDYETWDLSDELHVRPCPVGLPPSDAEQRMLKRQGSKLLPAGRPLSVLPSSPAQWAEFARIIHQSRSVEQPIKSGRRLLVGGEVTLSTVTRETAAEQTVYHFGVDEFREAIRGSLHPMEQLAPCQCGSGVRFIDCHGPKRFDEPCPCGPTGPGNLTFRECCAVDPATIDERDLSAA